MMIREEVMAPFFTKFHVDGPPFAAVLHRFTEADRGDFHDHPWPFRSIILAGGYVEEIVDMVSGRNLGATKKLERRPGDSFRNEAGHVHRIVDLLATECWTLILPEAGERKPGFYQFREDGAYHRFWDQPEFTLLARRRAA